MCEPTQTTGKHLPTILKANAYKITDGIHEEMVPPPPPTHKRQKSENWMQHNLSIKNRDSASEHQSNICVEKNKEVFIKFLFIEGII